MSFRAVTARAAAVLLVLAVLRLRGIRHERHEPRRLRADVGRHGRHVVRLLERHRRRHEQPRHPRSHHERDAPRPRAREPRPRRQGDRDDARRRAVGHFAQRRVLHAGPRLRDEERRLRLRARRVQPGGHGHRVRQRLMDGRSESGDEHRARERSRQSLRGRRRPRHRARHLRREREAHPRAHGGFRMGRDGSPDGDERAAVPESRQPHGADDRHRLGHARDRVRLALRALRRRRGSASSITHISISPTRAPSPARRGATASPARSARSTR